MKYCLRVQERGGSSTSGSPTPQLQCPAGRPKSGSQVWAAGVWVEKAKPGGTAKEIEF